MGEVVSPNEEHGTSPAGRREYSEDEAVVRAALIMLIKSRKAWYMNEDAAKQEVASLFELMPGDFPKLYANPRLLTLGNRLRLALFLEQVGIERRDDEARDTGAALRLTTTRVRAAHWAEGTTLHSEAPEPQRSERAWAHLQAVDAKLPMPQEPPIDPRILPPFETLLHERDEARCSVFRDVLRAQQQSHY